MGSGDKAVAEGGESPEDLAELLLRSLRREDELWHVFRADLEQRVKSAQPGKGDDTAEEVAERLRGLPQGRLEWSRATLALALAAALMILAGLGMAVYELAPKLAEEPWAPEWLRREAVRQVFNTGWEDAPPCEYVDVRAWRVTGPERLWRRHPEDPARYAAFIAARSIPPRSLPRGVMTGEPLPADFDATWRKIDPDNGFWLLLEAREMAERDGDGGPARRLALEALKMPRLDSYRQEMVEQRVRACRAPETTGQVLASAWEQGDVGYLMNLEWGGLQSALAGDDGGSLPKLNQWLTVEERERTTRMAWTAREREKEMKASFPGIITAWWRGLLWLGALIFFALAALAGLRRLPQKSAAARFARCVGQVLRPREEMVRGAAVAVLAAGIAAGCLAMAEEEKSESAICLAAPALGVVAVVMVTAAWARRRVARRTAFLGLATRGRVQRVAAPFALALSLIAFLGLVAVSLWSGGLHHWDDLAGAMSGPYAPRLAWQRRVLPVLGVMSGAALLWLGISALLGYASAAANVRHRLLVRQWRPALLAAALVWASLAVAGQPLESYLIRKGAATFWQGSRVK